MATLTRTKREPGRGARIPQVRRVPTDNGCVPLAGGLVPAWARRANLKGIELGSSNSDRSHRRLPRRRHGDRARRLGWRVHRHGVARARRRRHAARHPDEIQLPPVPERDQGRDQSVHLSSPRARGADQQVHRARQFRAGERLARARGSRRARRVLQEGAQPRRRRPRSRGRALDPHEGSRPYAETPPRRPGHLQGDRRRGAGHGHDRHPDRPRADARVR